MKMHFTFHGVSIFLLVLIAMGAVLWLVLAAIIAWAILHPPKMSAGKAIYHLQRLSPGDLGLSFEEQPFTVRDTRSGNKLTISSWWIPASTSSDRCVILIHGYADAKVGAIAWAPPLHELNLNILAIDLRAHGDSDGTCCTGGYFERDDVDQVIDQLLNLYPAQTQKIFLFGASLGAAVATAIAAKRADISAIILESPITDYERAIAAQIRLIGLPTGLLLKAAIQLAQQLSGAKFSDVRTIDLMKNVKCPVLTIIGSQDELLDADDFNSLKEATQSKPNNTFWPIENCGHLQAMLVDPKEYQRHLRIFLTDNSSRF